MYWKVTSLLLFVKCLFLLSFSTHFFPFFVAQMWPNWLFCCPHISLMEVRRNNAPSSNILQQVATNE